MSSERIAEILNKPEQPTPDELQEALDAVMVLAKELTQRLGVPTVVLIVGGKPRTVQGHNHPYAAFVDGGLSNVPFADLYRYLAQSHASIAARDEMMRQAFEKQAGKSKPN